MSDEIEALEKALRAVQQKYGYAYLDVSLHDTADRPNEFWVMVNYPNEHYSYEGSAETLREALSAASVDALNSEAAE